MDEKTLEKLYPEKSELSTLSFQEQLEFITFNSKNIKEKLKDNNKLLIQIPLNEIAKDNYIISLFCNLFCLSFIKPFPNDLVVNFIGKKREHIIFFYNFFTKHETLQKKYQGLLNDIKKNYEPFKLSERGVNNKKITPCEIIHYLDFEIEIKKFDFKRKEKDIEEIFKDINVSELNKNNLKKLFNIFTEIFNSIQVENERHKLKSTLLSRLVENITTFEGILHIFSFQRLFEAQFSEIKPKLNAKYSSILNQITLNQIDKSTVKKVNEHFIKNEIIDKEEKFFTGLINKEQMLKTMIIFSYFLDAFPENLISDIIIKLCKNQSRIYDSDLLMQLEKEPAITKVIENLFPINEENFLIQGKNFSEVIKEEKKISLYKHLNDLGLFTDNFNQFQKTSFCIKTKKMFLHLKQSIKWLDITHSDLIKLQKLDTDKLNNIIEVICFSNEDEITEIKEKLNLYMEIFNDLETKLNETIKFNNFYLPNKQNKLNELKKNLFENKLNLISIDEINDIIQNSDKALKYNKYTKSYVFKYKTEEERKNKPNDTYIKQMISKFNNEYKSIFQWNDTFKITSSKLNNLTYIFSKFNDESKYEDEIKLLSSDLFFNIKKYNINTVKEHFIILKKISALQMHLSNLKKFIDFFTNELNIKKNKEFDGNLQGLSKIPETIQGMKNIINNFNEDFTKKNAEIFQLLIENKENKMLIEFLCEHSNKSKNLLELMDVNEEGQRKELQVNDVVDFIDVLYFINEIKNIPDEYKSSNLDSKKLFEAIEKILQNKQKETFISKIKNVSLNFSLFNDLIKNVDKIGQSKATAQKLITNSSYSTSFDPNQGYQWNISYNTNTNETSNITLENFYDIGETLSFAKQKDKDKDKEDEIGQFCIFVNSIKDISETLQKLFMQGEKTEKIKFYINKEPMNKINSCVETKIKELKKNSKKIANAQKEFYKKNPLCFIFGKQFPLIYEFIYESQYKNKQNNVKEITHLFNYLTNWNFSEYPRIKNTDDYPSIEIITWDVLLKKIKIYLNELYSLNNNNGRSFFSDNLIADASKLNEKLGTLKTSEETIEIDIIKLYVKLTQNLPLPQMVLICNEYTTDEEIICFLHKACFCGEALLFYICNIEILSIEQTNLMVNFLNTNYTSKNVNEIKSLLVFGYTNMKSSIINQIHRYHSHLFKLIQVEKGVLEESLQNMIQTNLKVEIIKANESGQGKSFKIQSISKNTSSKYIYFPLGGNLNQQFLINRLIDCDFQTNSKEKQILFHLDLTDHHEIQEGKTKILKHFLFSILYFKVYSFKEKIVVLPKDIQIYIEIPNGFVKFPYQFLKFKETTIQPKEKMDYPYHRKSHIHVLMNYLKCYRQVENKTRAIQNLDLCFYKDEREIDRLKYKANDIHKGPDKPPKGKVIKYDEGLTYLEEEFTLNDEKKKLISPDTMNFYQITSIIKIMAENLNIFTDNIHMTANMDSKLKKLRPYFIENLVFLTHYLLNPDTYKELKEQQEMALKNEIENNDNNNNKKKKKAKEREYKGQLITFDDIKSSIIFINDDKQSLTIIPKSKSNEEYKILENFMSLSNEKLEYITDLDSKKFLFKVKRLLDIKDNDLSGTTQMPYVFTPDNYIKVIYIILRLRARIPIIMVGETGCGKTSLIKILAEIKKINMKVYNVHAETTEEEIANFFINDNELKPLEKNEVDNSENLSEKWVFFDEINTCNSLGLISEIMCKYSLHGKKLKSNLRFFAACNPFKLSKVQRTEGIEIIDNNNINNDIKKKNEKQLVYLVHPLPNSLLNFVFYCGQLKPEDERKYIERILLSQFEDKHKYKFDNFNIDCIDLCTQLISKSQIFLREKGLDSSVSLRDIRRFSAFYKWFIYMLTIKSSFSTLPYEKHDIYLRSIVLSLYICYYIRLIDKGLRSNYIDEIFKGYEIQFNKIIEEEQEDLASFILDDSTNNEGIAKNKPLLENIFCIFACINTKIPLILCGKPGCSKTLSVSKVYDALKGENSKNPFLRKFPNIYMKSYQGSMKSTSEGISRTFESARAAIRTSNGKSNNKEYQQQLTPLVFFDELGLAERAPGNPLKVLHYELEYDEDIGLSSNYKEKVAFVGVSNWSLDNAKMNRMVFLSIPELDYIDLKETAQNIAKSYSEQISTLYENEFGDLANTFNTFKTKINYIGEGNLFGLRDFYYFIKYVVIQLTQKQNVNSKTKTINDNEFHEIVFKGLERNFSGFPNSFELICDEYKQLKKINIQHIPTIGIKQCLLNNLNETKSRFLMLISKPYIGHYLFKDITAESHNNNNNNKEIQIFIGSKFPHDLQTDKYLLKQCNRIQLSLDKDNSIICLENHDRIYPSFYELFNKNYFSMGNKQYSKISYGYKKISLSEVNPNFRCAVFVDSDKVRSLEPPLLNRFEKQIISYKDILTSQENKYAEDIFDILRKIPYDINKDGNVTNKVTFIQLKTQLINCSLNEYKEGVALSELPIENIRGLVYHAVRHNNINTYEEIEQYVLAKIVNIFSQDIMSFISYSGFKERYERMYKKIKNIYEKKEKKFPNLKIYMDNVPSMKSIIYTFSNILDNNHINMLKQNSQLEYIANYKSEDDLENDIDKFFNSKPQSNDKKSYFVLYIKQYEIEYLFHINSVIDNVISKQEKQNIENKYIIFIVFLTRQLNDKNEEKPKEELYISSIPFIDESIHQIFIDNLNKNQNTNSSINNSNINSNNTTTPDLSKIFETIIDDSSITIQRKLKYYNNDNKSLIQTIQETISSNTFIKNEIINIVKQNVYSPSFIYNILFYEKGDFLHLIDFISIEEHQKSNAIEQQLGNFIIQLLKDNALAMMTQNAPTSINNVWKKYLSSLTPANYMKSYEVNIDLMGELQVPSSFAAIKRILPEMHNQINQYLLYQNQCRREGKAFEFSKYLKICEAYRNKKKGIIAQAVEVVRKDNVIKLIEQEKLLNKLLKDYFICLIYYDQKLIVDSGVISIFQILEKYININDAKIDKDKDNECVYNIEQFVEIVMWFECNITLVRLIVQIYNTLSNKNFKKIFEQTIVNNNNNNEHCSSLVVSDIVNAPFIKIFNSLSSFFSKHIKDVVKEKELLPILNLINRTNIIAKQLYLIELSDLDFYIVLSDIMHKRNKPINMSVFRRAVENRKMSSVKQIEYIINNLNDIDKFKGELFQGFFRWANDSKDKEELLNFYLNYDNNSNNSDNKN